MLALPVPDLAVMVQRRAGSLHDGVAGARRRVVEPGTRPPRTPLGAERVLGFGRGAAATAAASAPPRRRPRSETAAQFRQLSVLVATRYAHAVTSMLTETTEKKRLRHKSIK